MVVDKYLTTRFSRINRKNYQHITLRQEPHYLQSITTGSDWDVRSVQILRELNWMSFGDRRTNQLKTLIFKTVNEQVPEYLSKKISKANDIHSHNLRGSEHNLFIPRPNTNALKKSFGYRGAVLWNSLSQEAKQAINLSNFRRIVDI